ncbi:Na+/H+ antiporter NhaC family protein [Salipaludibacillus aurantiacus]|uniref:Na+:H+ antiporter, NhaC family n=1 Tax=Salipaludibacillus aurantiacus TaxID=1601833 RepID=A0A1H9W9S9_9BACI|nr:Na+/H+ antiporter NhaC family protein [Salipaludibacillus aurantiacus]SES30706.1 Na+:H+ antiporter, NhaC family [Salipaludibacillus aurantiacus]
MTRTFTLTELLLILGVTVAVLMTAILNNFSLVLAIMPGLFLLVGISVRKGFSFSELSRSAFFGIKRNKDVAWLLTFIGILLPTWHFAGTINDLNALFLTVINPAYFFVIAFLITAVMSLIVGSAIGSLSIAGVPVMAAGDYLGLPMVIVGGALVSGAFVGDRSSPLSSSFFLLSYALEVTVRQHFRAILPTLMWTVFLTAGLFLSLDLYIDKGDALNNGTARNFSELNIGQLAVSFIPALVLLIMILTGKNMKISFTSSIAAAFAILFFRDVPLGAWGEGVLAGAGQVNGIIDMLPFILFILLVGVYSQIIEDTQLIQPYIEKVFTNKSSLAVNTSQSIGIAAAVSLISPNQSFPIILTGRSLLPHWAEYFSKRQLSRILADSTVVFAGLVPWSLLAILCSTIIGVPVLEYAPFAFFLLLSPAVTMVYSVLSARKAYQ